MLYIKEDCQTLDKVIVKTSKIKDKEGQTMSNYPKVKKDEMKNTIILTSHPVTVQSVYVTPYKEHLSIQEKYCKDNNLNIIKIINLPRFGEEVGYWLQELKRLIRESSISYVVIDSNDFFYTLFDLNMLYSALEPCKVEIIDECDYLEDEDILSYPDEEGAVLVTLLTDIRSMTKSADLASARYEWENQKDLLFKIATDDHYEIEPLVFVAINDYKTWDSFCQLLDAYIQVRNVESIIIRGDGEHKEFTKSLVEYFCNDPVNIMVSQPKLRIMTDSVDLYLLVDEFEREDDNLPFA